jgi:hypothetical protein
MRFNRQSISVISILIFSLAMSWNSFFTGQMVVSAYYPSIGDKTEYNYGFISIQPNQTAANVDFWTGLELPDSNYTMHWHQFVNLTIRVTNIAQIGLNILSSYNISVNIHSNQVTLSNNSWQTTIILNNSVSTPVPTGMTNQTFFIDVTEGYPGFFLGDTTLSQITPGSNVNIGTSRWHTISFSSFTLGGVDHICYQLFNTSVTSTELLETTFVIDQDIGVYFQANETRTLSVGSIQQVLTYYYHVRTTNISLIPPPNPLLLLLIIGIVVVVLIIVLVVIIRAYWLHRQR